MRHFFLAIVFLWALPVNAATFTYHYQGALLDQIVDNNDGTATIQNGFSATLILDEYLLGQSLFNANISFFLPGLSGLTPQGPVQGVLGFITNYADLTNTVAGTDFRMQTNASGNLTGTAFWLDGPPDGFFGSTTPDSNGIYDWYHDSINTIGSSQPGTWSLVSIQGDLYVAPVPLPTSSWLLITALLGLVLFSRNRSHKLG